MPAIHRCRKQDEDSRKLKATDANAWAIGSPADKKTDKDDLSYDPAVQPGKEAGIMMNKGDVCPKCGTVIS